jgi:predicted transposase/invertase (TIGR01784 family)
MAGSATPHDNFAKAVFSDPQRAAVILRAVLPEALLKHLDFGDAKLEPSLFVNEELRDRHSDFLYSVSLAGEEAYVLVLLEHQSAANPVMPARAFFYLGRAVERYLLQNPDAKTIPAMIPVVLFHGQGGWTAATELSDLFALPAGLDPAVIEQLPSLKLFVDDLHATTDDALRDRPGAVLSRVALIVLRHAQELRRAGDPRAVLEALARSIADLLEQAAGRGERTVVLRYMLEIVELSPREGEDVLVRALSTEAKEDVVTAADQLRQEGRKEGVAKGRLSTLREVLTRLLCVRFGDVGGYAEQIETADEDSLTRWIDQVVGAASLEDVFTPQG